VDAHLTRAFADGLKGAARPQVLWYPEMYHEVLNDPKGSGSSRTSWSSSGDGACEFADLEPSALVFRCVGAVHALSSVEP